MSFFFKQKQLPGNVSFEEKIYNEAMGIDKRMVSIISKIREDYKNNIHLEQALTLLRKKSKAFMGKINLLNDALHNESKSKRIEAELAELKRFQSDFYNVVFTIISEPSLIHEAKNYYKDSVNYTRVGGKHGERSFTVYDTYAEDAAEIGIGILLVGAVLVAASIVAPPLLLIGIPLMAIASVFLAPALFYFFVETLPNIVTTWIEEEKLFDSLELLVNANKVVLDRPEYSVPLQESANTDEGFTFSPTPTR